MKTSRWDVLWKAIVRWWKNEGVPQFPHQEFLRDARKSLVDYDELYCKRTKVNPLYSNQVAEIALQEGRKRAPVLESEVRVLAITVKRLLGYLEAESTKEKS